MGLGSLEILSHLPLAIFTINRNEAPVETITMEGRLACTNYEAALVGHKFASAYHFHKQVAAKWEPH